jgi:hypothetical protein
MVLQKLRRYKKGLTIFAVVLGTVIVMLVIFVNRFVEPILRDRLRTLIVQGSDSLYQYSLGSLEANFFGGSVEVENLHIRIDSARYEVLRRRNALPSLTMQLDLEKGSIRGLGILPLLFGKKIKISEIMSHDANIRLSRHLRKNEVAEASVPLWKALQPNINSIQIDRIRLDGVKLLYRNADTSESVKLQFDRCDALFEDIRVDSAATSDSTRLAFAGNIWMRMHDLKFRAPDSSFKLKAEWITYSSRQRTIEVDSFKIQPTLEEKEDFYAAYGIQKPMQEIELEKVRMVNVHLDRFIHNNIIQADSIIFQKPDIEMYLDRSMRPTYESKIGKFPHQQLLNATPLIRIQNITVRDGSVEYQEKNPKTEAVGTFSLSHLDLSADNITNDTSRIRLNPVCTAKVSGRILGGSPITTTFRFYLDSLNGRFDAQGTVTNVTAVQLNALSVPMANVQMKSFTMKRLDFQVTGEDYGARANVQMLYDDLDLILRKTDEETGEVKNRKFLTKILNKFVIWPSNPGPGGAVRTANNVYTVRLTTKSFFGVLWKAIFAGMQDIMMKSGRYE